MALGNLQKDICSYTFCISMRIHQFLELYSIYCICMRIYFAGIFTQKFSDFCFFFQNRQFGEYFCKMSPKKSLKRRGSLERERMFTQVQARSPDLDELSCVPETQQIQYAAVWRRWWWEWRILWRCRIKNKVTLRLRHSRIRIQEVRTLLTHRTCRLLRAHRMARAKARASQGAGRGNMYRK